MTDEVSYSKEQKGIVRRALNGYLEHEGEPGKPIKLYRAFRDMMSSPVIDQSIFTGKEEKSVYERVRVFAAGSPEIPIKILQSLVYFLVDRSVLKLEELQADPRFKDKIISVHASIGVRSWYAARRRRIDGRYQTSIDNNFALEVIELTFEETEIPNFWKIDELFSRRFTGRSKYGSALNVNSEIKSQQRDGYGFLSTDKGLLHIFLKGGTTGDRVHYVEPLRTRDDIGREEEIFLVRLGHRPIQRIVRDSTYQSAELFMHTFSWKSRSET